MPEGAVFDLGYRPHEGPRLGRPGAARALFADGVRRVFGLRRKARRKVLPAVLIAIAVLPALFYVAVGVVVGEMGTEAFFGHSDYFTMSGNVSLVFSPQFELSGIALGTIVTVAVYHLAHALAPKELRDAAGGTVLIVDEPGIWTDEDDGPAKR